MDSVSFAMFSVVQVDFIVAVSFSLFHSTPVVTVNKMCETKSIFYMVIDARLARSGTDCNWVVKTCFA